MPVDNSTRDLSRLAAAHRMGLSQSRRELPAIHEFLGGVIGSVVVLPTLEARSAQSERAEAPPSLTRSKNLRHVEVLTMELDVRTVVRHSFL